MVFNLQIRDKILLNLKKNPWKKLSATERILKPEFVIGSQKPGNTFPTKKPVKTVALDFR